MWIFGNSQSNERFYEEFPHLPISQLSYMPRPLPWRKYPHLHQDEYEFGFVVSGRGILYLPGTECAMEPGSLTLVPPGAAHYYISDPGTDLEYYTLRVLRQDAGGPARDLLSRLNCCTCISLHADSLRIMLQAARSLARQDGDVISRPIQMICLACLDIALQELSERGQTLSLSAPEYAYDILCYLQEHLQEKLSLADLAEHFHLSASHISRVFSRTYHISPINYLIMSRMGRARTYILEDHLPPAEIARKLAYGDTWQFINAFTKFFGCRPEEYYSYVKRTEE